jgi:basic membrane protein A
MIRKALLLSFVISASLFAPITSSATTPVNLCVAYDLGGPGDRSYNDAVLAGLVKAKKTLDFNFEGFVNDGSDADRDTRIRAMIEQGCSPILAIGSGYSNLLKKLAVEFPNQQFAILNDASISSLNVTSLIFADKQVGYLAGSAAARVSKTGKIAVISKSENLDLESGFTLGATTANKKIRITIKSATADLTGQTKSLMAAGNDVIFIAIDGSDNEIFSEVVKYNVSKKKNVAEVGVITIEPDQYLTVTAATKKYLLAAVSKRVDNAIFDLASSAIKDQQILNILDSEAGIYGRRYDISGGNIELLIWAPKLQALKAANAASSRLAAKL